MNTPAMVKKNRVIMVGTAFDTMGGISSVVNVYRENGLFERCNVHYIASHCDGNAAEKLKVMTAALFQFLKLLIFGHVGLLHVHVSSRASFWRKTLFFLPAFIFRVPTILHLHSSAFPVFYEKECGTARKILIRYVFNHADRVVVLSSMWKVWVNSISTNPRVATIYNPVTLPRIAERSQSRVTQRVLSLGRLGGNKGTYDLITAVAMVMVRHPTLQLKLGGDGELKAAAQHANTYGIDQQVELLGWIRGAEKERQLASSGIYALPSYNEGLPMSVLEAMAAGLPILSTPIGGIPEAVSDGVEGFLVQPGDVSALALRLEQLLTEPGLAERMGAAARHKVETTFSADFIVPQVEALYRELGFRPDGSLA